ncbi:hypothetical protein [Novosphingobium guangzhouense]|uniref:Phosphoribosyl-ATP diphosphatase n=1 Tax=Novosphingobium guangzhouense TaxID=1850347 RepID=A0A2K2FZ71_9SPHN|nr:hypothetical protein [Novosphingobium guangzhouense]PNU04044.1 hypothetical protein A8V01_05375 [Novosphingobium guangzhouense]
MGLYAHDGFVGRGESQWQRMNELEYAEKAQVLKALARELGQETGPAIDELARHGLEAALAVLALATGAGVGEDYKRCRAAVRVS